MAPHLVRPLRFVLPQGPGARPRVMVRAGLYLYDRLGGAGPLPGARQIDLRDDPLGAPLRDTVRLGFSYADCRTDDARLTIVSARDAGARGAEIATRTALVEARRAAGIWLRVASHASSTTRSSGGQVEPATIVGRWAAASPVSIAPSRGALAARAQTWSHRVSPVTVTAAGGTPSSRSRRPDRSLRVALMSPSRTPDCAAQSTSSGHTSSFAKTRALGANAASPSRAAAGVSQGR